jgi:hypothetical protein
MNCIIQTQRKHKLSILIPPLCTNVTIVLYSSATLEEKTMIMARMKVIFWDSLFGYMFKHKLLYFLLSRYTS